MAQIHGCRGLGPAALYLYLRRNYLSTCLTCSAYSALGSAFYNFSKSPLASENFVDIFNLLPRWQLDPVDISCPQFRYIVSTMKDTACLRTFESIRFISTSPAGPIRVNWQFAENIEKEDLSITFSEMDEALGDTKKRILSSAIGCFQFWDLYFADEMLVVSSFFDCCQQ